MSEAATCTTSPSRSSIRSRVVREGSDSTPAVTTEHIVPPLSISLDNDANIADQLGGQDFHTRLHQLLTYLEEFGPVPSGEAAAAGTPMAAAAHRVVNPPPGRELAASACTDPPRSGM